MPALRLPNRRRKSSHNITYTPAKPGIYGVPSRSSTAVTFAPNVTPISYSTPDADEDPLNPLASLEDDDAAGPHVKALRAQIFPESVDATANGAQQKRKRTPPGKRPSQGYIPRPPNAFMLFRAAFVKQRHVPGSIETNHRSLSKIIGNCWRQLPLEEKKIWEKRAKEEKAAHKVRFPDYRFRPVHNKNKAATAPSAKSSGKADGRTKERQATTAEEEQRCEDISTLILEGKAGDELEAAIRHLDRARVLEKERLILGVHDEYEYDFEESESHSHGRSGSRRTSVDFSRHASPAALHLPYPIHPAFSQQTFNLPNNSATYHRRSSSVPLPNDWFASSGPFLGSASGSSGIAIPTLPPLASLSRAPSPSPMGVGSIAISRFAHARGQSQSQGMSGFQAAQEQFFHHHHQHESTFNFAQQTPQPTQQLFHPAPQTPTSTFHQSQSQTTPRSSFGFGMGMGMNMRRASSAQAMLMRSWTMPVDPGSFDYGMSLGMDVDMGMGMDAGHGAQMERDPSPLPDVESGLFADFSFGSSNTTSIDSNSSLTSEPVHHKSPSPILAPIDTSISPLDAEQPSALSAASTSASTSASASPAPSVSDVLPEMSSINMGMGMGPLDCLYPSMHAMGSYMDMDMMYGYEMDPVVSQHENVHSPKPIRTPTATEASFAELAGEGGY
ncbi:hypothetical protein GALMADRAFT_252018 [Galerina marginata CBS 339.88]|uniref:HMG box domain-containing protein n=1 Tax=Galerina marginata (strain CBS 339.88) TaxID=685588 RepID=A0A067T306_GALM3|nr:hypothetical protein GALMADRAFT_252018 [Galerina marginata CBS 339.88]